MRSAVSLTVFLLLAGIISLAAAGCGSYGRKYSKDLIPESVADICKKEYKIDVLAHLEGETLAIFVPLDNLLDYKFDMSREAGEKIMDVVLAASRVALSSDAGIKFYCVFAQDPEVPEMQVVLINYVDDVKRARTADISITEFMKRRLVDKTVNPQAEKEETVKKIFNKFNLDKKWQEDMLGEFFRTDPLHISEMGYWQGRFYVKNITLEEYIAEQISRRIKRVFMQDWRAFQEFLLKDVESIFVKKDNKEAFFDVKFNAVARPLVPGSPRGARLSAKPGEAAGLAMGDADKAVLKIALDESADAIYAYRFKGFSSVRIFDKARNKGLEASRDDIYNYKGKKITFDQIYARNN